MSRNVEIKAKLKNLEDIISKAKQLSGTDGKKFPQIDHYFNVPNGRLKLRFSESMGAELIFYDRPNDTGPKLCSYNKTYLEDGISILQLLSNALGKRGVVKKTRHLFMIGQTRVHVDSVDNLGSYAELEVVLEAKQTPQQGMEIAEKLMDELNISKDDLISHSYIDMIHKD